MGIALVNTGLFLGAAQMQPAFGWVLDLTWDGTLMDGFRVYGAADGQNGPWRSQGGVALALAAR